ncbi:diphthamide biosynthesis protein [Methanocalculus chunghsingensis]|uniref:2-(3-amino-3-carboxypropyl)histidine synthase n=1 Tax=Methanocalculus chunghsingensis TaxID=156457 RepID=A0A8J8B5V9_9EURY|nr:diphthamide biosynthesis enzyme Dph2 [Methanocalculus chunghsingensis]MBR1369459.1 diphthamide biosynthesis protein [Methanocalculus chunghsingensis]
MSLIPTSEIIRKAKMRGAQRIALQAPEGLKRRLPDLAEELRREGFSVLISGDPCYGACDTAVDALEWADLLIHLGHTPLGDDPRILFEPVCMETEIPPLDRLISLLKGPAIGLISTVQHAPSLPRLADELRKHGFHPVIAAPSPRTPLPGQVLGCTYAAAREAGADELVYFGTGLFHPIGSAIATGRRVITLDPFTGDAGVVETERLLRRRFAVIEKARSADRFGIIVSQKSGQERMRLAEALAALHPRAGIVLLREVSGDQLINLGFPCYVNTACPRLALDDQIRFPVPVLSPPEFEILCGRRKWDDYVIDEIVA